MKFGGHFKRMIVIFMGVCGVGKTAVGESLAKELKVTFRDADEFHSLENKAKMSKKIPLTDEDRLPWLHSINNFIVEMLDENRSAILTCSALKKIYRQILMKNCTGDVKIIYLKGSKECIKERLEKRRDHFMHVDMLTSQFITLEDPTEDEVYCLTIDTDGKTIQQIVEEAKRILL